MVLSTGHAVFGIKSRKINPSAKEVAHTFSFKFHGCLSFKTVTLFGDVNVTSRPLDRNENWMLAKSRGLHPTAYLANIRLFNINNNYYSFLMDSQ